ncbi:MAG: hypothetical protein AUJ92_20190 [Armatimonadetes bacterium CG2_30_59_28]|nr:hypothetical protein [Armatimonadota bacterium]OIO89932.1 MAG: hypothetical protein AUJ92_20190 [Armatimonadetes bacterium CG2_30_59_28]
MEIPRRLLEQAAELMTQSRGLEALQILQNYNVTSFGQLERLCRGCGIETWKQEDYDLHKNAPDYFR